MKCVMDCKGKKEGLDRGGKCFVIGAAVDPTRAVMSLVLLLLMIPFPFSHFPVFPIKILFSPENQSVTNSRLREIDAHPCDNLQSAMSDELV